MLIVSLDKCFNILEDNGHYLRSKHGFLKKSLVLDISNLCKHKMRSLMLKKSLQLSKAASLFMTELDLSTDMKCSTKKPSSIYKD